MGCKKSIQAVGINSGSIASVLTDYPSHRTLTHIQRASIGPMQVLQLSVWFQCASTSVDQSFIYLGMEDGGEEEAEEKE